MSRYLRVPRRVSATCRSRAEFPCIKMELMEWFQYIGEAPPRFYLVRDGEAIYHWDEHVLPIEEILAAREGRLPKSY